MKTKILILAMLLLGCAFAKAQKTGNTSNRNIQKQIDSTGNFNLLDGGANVLGDIFGNMGGVEEMQGVESYKDLLEKSDLSTAQKEDFLEQYKLIELNNDPLKKKEMELKLTEILQKAIKESQKKDN